MRCHELTGHSSSHRVTSQNPHLDRRIGCDERGRVVPSKDGQAEWHFGQKRRVSPMLAMWYICSRIMRETYELKVFSCSAYMRKSNQQGSAGGCVRTQREDFAVLEQIFH